MDTATVLEPDLAGGFENLHDDQPALTFQASCLNSRPEAANNLAYSLLMNGAVGTIGATRESWYHSGDTTYVNSTTIAGFAYQYTRLLVKQSNLAGDALRLLRSHLTFGWETRWANFLLFNLYGDPAIGLGIFLFQPYDWIFPLPDLKKLDFPPHF